MEFLSPGANQAQYPGRTNADPSVPSLQAYLDSADDASFGTVTVRYVNSHFEGCEDGLVIFCSAKPKQASWSTGHQHSDSHRHRLHEIEVRPYSVPPYVV